MSRYVWAGLALFVGLTTLFMIVRTFLGIPNWDSWAQLTIADQVANLFVSHDRHVITVPHLFYIFDDFAFSGSSAFNFFLTLLLLVADAALLAWVAKRAGLPFVYRGFVFMALLWAYPVNNFLSGFNVQIICVFVVATASLAVLAFGRERGLPWAIALGFVATFTMANGVLTGLLLAPLAFCLSLPRRQVVIAAVAGLAMIGSYASFSHGGTDVLCADVYKTGVAFRGISLEYIGSILGYLGVYLGAPVGRLLFRAQGFSDATILGTALIGYAALAVALALVVRAFLDDKLRRKPELLFLVALLAFLVGTAAVTAYGRGFECPVASAATSRYGTSAVMFWTVLVLLAGMVKFSSHRWAELVPTAGAALFGLAIVVSQPVIVKAMIVSPGMGPSSADQRTEQFLGGGHQADRVGAMTAILSNVADNAALRFVMIPDQHEIERFGVLRAHRMAPFDREWTRWLGSPLPASLDRNDSSCRGTLDTFEPLSGGGWRIGGTLEGSAEQFSKIVAVSRAGIVVGYAVRSPGRSLSEAVLNRNPRWQGHVNGAAERPVTLYALDLRRSTACSFARTG